MFHSPLYHAYPHYQPAYIDLAALAEAKAAEAAEKAAQAEYLALQARARAMQQQRFEATFYDYPSYVVSDHFGNHRVGVAGYPSTYLSPFEPMFSERDLLEAVLKEERLARLRAERELRLKEQELQERERRLFQGHTVFMDAPTKPKHQAEGAVPKFDLKTFITSLAQPASSTVQKPRSSPKPSEKPSQEGPSVEELLLNSLFGAPIQPKAGFSQPTRQSPKGSPNATPKTTENKKPLSPSKSSTASTSESLLDQLKAKHEKEGDTEVRDTVQAVLNSLSDSNNYINAAAIRALSDHPSRSTSTSAKTEKPQQDTVGHLWATINALSSPLPSTKADTVASEAASSTQTSQLRSDAKGKRKETTPSTPTTAEATSRDVKTALDRVERITTTFKHLSADFAFPSKLDFTIDTANVTVSSSKPSLAFTARNHPVHNYEQTLISLLSQLDLIESYGDPTLRNRRKDAARAIEEALEELEREIIGRWKASLARFESSAAQMIDTREGTEAPKEVSVKAAEEKVKEEDAAKNANSTSIAVPSPVLPEEALPEASTLEVEKSDSVDELIAHQSTSTPAAALEPSATCLFPKANNLTQPQSETDAVTSPSTQPETNLSGYPTTSFVVPVIEKPIAPSLQFDALEVEAEVSSSSGRNVTESNVGGSSPAAEDDAFLFARTPSPGGVNSPRKGTKRRSVEIEDLGSDWEDLDS